MGGAKDLALQRDENIARAASYLATIGMLERCEYHGEIFGGANWDLDGDFYKQVMGDRKRGDRGPIPWAADMPQVEFTDLMKEAYEAYPGDGCGQCEKNMRD